VQRILIIAGLLLALAGILWPWIAQLPFGRLPGDIVVDRPGFKLFVPFSSMLILSIVLSLIFWLLRK
jgi:hypothetical protein